MKKSLSFLVALALVFGLFASMASAADTSLTTAQKYQQFLDKGILKGDPSGDPRLSANLNRAEFVTIADAVNGLAPVNSAVATFSDVKKGQWWYGAIEAAAKAGLVNGIGLGKFGPKLNVTVEQAIKVFVLSAGLKPVDGAKVEGASDWAGPFIKAAQDANFPVPSNYKANATRGQAIDLAYAAYLAKAVPTLSDVTATVNADDSVTVAGKVVGTVDKVTVANGTADAVAATLKDDKSFSYTSDKLAAGNYTFKVVAYEGTKASAAVEKTVTVDAFSVVSATVSNSKQIIVKLNKPVQEGTLAGGASYDKDSDGKLDYYKLGANVLGSTSTTNTVYPIKATLNDDKTAITLTFKDGFANGSVAQFNVLSGLKSASGKNLVEYKQAITLTDVTAPAIDKVTYSGLTAKVTFTEPVLLGSYVVSVNGVQVGTSSATTSVYYDPYQDPDTGYVTLTFKNLEGGKSYNVSIVGIKDLASPANRANLTTTLNVPDDTVPPTITSVVAEGSNLRIKFSEPIDNAKQFAVSATALSTVYVTTATDDNNEVVVNLRGWVTSNYLNTTVTISDYYDLVGNKGAKFNQAVTLTKDNTAPAVSSVTVSGKKIIVKFNEAISDNTNGVAVSKVASVDFVSSDLVRKYGVALNGVTDFKYAYDANGDGDTNDSGEKNYLVIDVDGSISDIISNGMLKNGSYTLKLGAKAVSDGYNDNANELSVSFTVTGNAASGGGVIALDHVDQTAEPSVLSVYLSKVGSDGLSTSQLNASNFLIDGQPIPSDSKLFFNHNVDASGSVSIYVELPSGAIPVDGPREFTIANIVDKNGNSIDGDHKTVDIRNVVAGNLIVKENSKPTLVSASVGGDDRLTLTFSEKVSVASLNGVDILVNNNKLDTSASGVNAIVLSVDTNVVVIKVKAGTFAAGQSVKVNLAGASGIKDGNGNSAANVDGVTAQ